VAVITKLVKGFDPDYPWKQMGATAGDYFLVKGEPRGRWWGSGAAGLGLEPGSEVDRKAYRQLIAEHLDPRDGETRLGRAPGTAAARAEALYREKLKAEPHATFRRQFELRREAAREARQGPAYLELDNSFSKSITTFWALLGENARSARLSGDKEAMAYWGGLLHEFDEMLYAANQAGLSYFEREAGYTRSGYHGRRVGGQEAGHFDEARLVFAQFLQHTSREDDPHLHVHNIIATVAKTIMDSRWRTPDSYGYNEVFMAVSAVVSLYLEASLRRRFGVRFTPRGCQCAHGTCADPATCRSNFGCEIKGITRSDVECFSTRRESVNAELRERAAEFESEHGRAPSQRELAQMHQEAWDKTRKQKPPGGIDFDALHSGWAERLRQRGRELESIAPEVWDEATVRRGGHCDEDDGGAQLEPGMLRRAALKVLARCQAQQSKWNRYQLIHELGSVLPPQVRDLAPERMLPLLEDLADRTLAGEFEPVVCLEAPELVEVPESLRRSDGLPVYRRHMGAKYATAAHLSTEEQLLADAGRSREPLIERERAATLLGSDVSTLSAQLERKPEAGSDERTATGLRLDQAAAIWSALTDRKTSTVLTGPAGSGKTYTLAAAAAAARRAGVRYVYGTAASQAARNVLAAKLAQMGVSATVLNSSQFLDRTSRPDGDPRRLGIAPGSLILVDEASMLPTSHAAAIKRLAAQTGSKELFAGDQEQLQAVQEGGAMGLQARQHGYLQLAEPVRFAHRWERDASLRLRAGDAAVAGVYDQQGRVRGGSPEEVLEAAAQTAVTLLADGQDVILMARSRDHVRELSRRVRDELLRLGIVEAGRSVPLAEGARAGVHDLIVVRKNDHRAGLANGDIVRVEAIEDDGRVLVRKATGRDPATGAPVFGDRTITRSSLRQADSAYARTVHTAQGGQGTTGLAVVTGDEDRQWLYPAMTRGTDANYAFVMTGSPRTSDPAAGPAPAPELARFDRLERSRAGLPAEEEATQKAGHREAAGVLADVAGRDGTELSATEYRQRQLASADHLGLLDAMWQDAISGPRTERYRQLLLEVVPPAYAAAADESAKATWLWRTLRAVEAAGLDAREVMQAAVNSRDLAGARDVAAVIDDRIRRQAGAERLVPLPQGRWSEQVPQVDDPAQQKYLGELAAAMDGRAERLGAFTAGQAPQWATGPLGPVPADPEARAGWEAKAAAVAAYRELYAWDSPSEPIGPEPAMATPEKRAAWHAAAAALGRPADGPDLRSRDTGSLLLIRDSYEAETAWAPRFVTPELRSIRSGAQHEELVRARAAAEARAAEGRGDLAAAQRQRGLARAAETLRDWYQARTAELEVTDADYRDWEHTTEGARALAIAADAELRRREPGLALRPLRSAEPAPVTDVERAELDKGPGENGRSPAWVERLAQARPAFREQLAERHSVRVPDPDPEYADHGPAWPSLVPSERDAILQPPVLQMPAAPGLGRQIEPEAGL
jgi:conjugative relaxase-like TrwC/TraI family protein